MKYKFKSCYKDLKQDLWHCGKPSIIDLFITVLFSQEFHLLALYRFGRLAVTRNCPRITRFFVFLQQRLCSCQISPRSHIEPGVRFPHPLSVVVGDGCYVEKGVWLFQCTTLGGKPDPTTGKLRYPSVKAGAKLFPQVIALGSITIGENARIGAASLVLCDVPDYATAVGSPARVVSSKETTNHRPHNA